MRRPQPPSCTRQPHLQTSQLGSKTAHAQNAHAPRASAATIPTIIGFEDNPRAPTSSSFESQQIRNNPRTHPPSSLCQFEQQITHTSSSLLRISVNSTTTTHSPIHVCSKSQQLNKEIKKSFSSSCDAPPHQQIYSKKITTTIKHYHLIIIIMFHTKHQQLTPQRGFSMTDRRGGPGSDLKNLEM